MNVQLQSSTSGVNTLTRKLCFSLAISQWQRALAFDHDKAVKQQLSGVSSVVVWISQPLRAATAYYYTDMEFESRHYLILYSSIID